MQDQCPRIAVLVDTSSGWGRRVIRGISSYVNAHRPWQLSIETYGRNEAMHLKRGWQGEGVIARVKDKSLLNELLTFGKPVVNVSNIQLEGMPFPRVTTDPTDRAQRALDHFTERGFQHLAYYQTEELGFAKPYRDALAQAIKAQKLTWHTFRSAQSKQNHCAETARRELHQWLKQLPKPVGILTWGASEGRHILNVCDAHQLKVPEQVAVLAADDDSLLCQVSSPSISAIRTPAQQIGFHAARILDGLLLGGPAPSEPLLLKQSIINTRQSTDALAVIDPLLSKAIHHIRQNYHRAIQVDEVAEAVQLSRRSLERRFKAAIGHPPAKEIQRVRLQRAQQLLRETNMSVVDVAAVCGYSSPEYMIGIFRKATGRTPINYRNHSQAV